MSKTDADTELQRAAAQRLTAEMLLLGACGLVAGLIGPYGSDDFPPAYRFAYWMAAIVGGGLVGILADDIGRHRIAHRWRRTFLVALAITPVIALYILFLDRYLLGNSSPPAIARLLWQVLVLALVVLGIRTLARREPAVVVQTRTLVEPPVPDAGAALRRRLPARLRSARLLAVEAHDHYVRVHTDAGAALLTWTFAEAVAGLAGAHGYRTHRSWWVAADAIVRVRWRRGAGEIDLADGLVAPLSRANAPLLRVAGWL